MAQRSLTGGLTLMAALTMSPVQGQTPMTKINPVAAADPVAAGPVAADPVTADPVTADPVPAGTVTPDDSAQRAEAAFRDWIASFRARALDEGVAPQVYDRVMATVEYQPEIVAREDNQAEFNRTIGQYLARAVSEQRLREGNLALHHYHDLFRRIEATYGVDKEVIAAIWGMESSYGTYRGELPVIPSLASLARGGRRPALFAAQLIAALKILQTGEVSLDALRGSWAGAMGHTQFMPISWLDLAVDFDGDGRRDIWDEDPSDALASTAAYLVRFGWTFGQPWAIEVRLPASFDYSNSGKQLRKPSQAWRDLGVRTIAGEPLPDHGEAALLLPAGAGGPAFLIYSNFRVIERYNAADAYVISVGHLADRLAGGDVIQTSWPAEERALGRLERVELQERLTSLGFDTKGADGMIGPNSLNALRAFQTSRGMTPDAYPSLAMLEILRATAPPSASPATGD
jgi:membrane-bound lytic murein transglycosylase B